MVEFKTKMCEENESIHDKQYDLRFHPIPFDSAKLTIAQLTTPPAQKFQRHQMYGLTLNLS